MVVWRIKRKIIRIVPCCTVNSSYKCSRACWFRFSLKVFYVFLLIQGQFVCFVVSFCVLGVFSLVCFELSVPVQVIAWKD